MWCTVMFTERNTCLVTALTDNEDFNQNIISRPKGEREKIVMENQITQGFCDSS